MALIVEDGSGLPNADAYVDIAFVDQYNSDYIGDTNWTGLTTVEQERAIRSATQYLDNTYHTQWKGTKANEDQALDWPRSNVTTQDCYTLPDDELPLELQQACAEAAIRAGTESLVSDVESGGGIKRTFDKVDVLETEIEYFSPGATSSGQKKYPTINNLLISGDLIESGRVAPRA